MELVYTDPWGGRIIFVKSVLDRLWRSRQLRFRQNERGGLLYATFEGDETRIQVASGPLRPTSSGRLHFKMSLQTEHQDIQEHYARGLHYVGHWHTHPQQVPVPSTMDLDKMSKLYRRSLHDLRGMVMVVVGRGRFPDGLSVTVHTEDAHELPPPLKR